MARRVSPADLVLLLITLFWGTTFTLVKGGLAHASTFAFLAARFGVGATALGLLPGEPLRAPLALRAGGVQGTLLFLGFALQTAGLRLGAPSRVAFLTGLTVVGVTVASAFRRARPGATSVLGVALVAAGALSMIAWPDAHGRWDGLRLAMLLGGLGLVRELSRPVRAAVAVATLGLAVLTRPIPGEPASPWQGDAFTLLANVAFGWHLLRTEWLVALHPVRPLVWSQFVAVAGWAALLAPAEGIRFEPSPALWGAIVFCGVFCTAGCIGLQAWAMKRASAARAALLFTLEPVFAALFAAVWTGKPVTGQEWLGGALIVGATLVEPLAQLLRPPVTAAAG